MTAKHRFSLLLTFMTALFLGGPGITAKATAGAAGPIIHVSKEDIDTRGIGTALQRALEEAAKRGTASVPCTVKVQPGTYTLQKENISIGSNTTLDLTGVTLKRSGTSSSGKYYNMVFLGLPADRAPNGNPNEGAAGYAFQNITIKGGTLDGSGGNTTVLKLCHAANITVSGVTLKNAHNAHLMEIAGVDGVTISNCHFSDQLLDQDAEKRTLEAIQVDVLTHTHIWGYRPEALAARNIKITDCTFRNVPRGVGGHTLILNCPIEGITVSGCNFSDIKSAAIRSFGWTNCHFTNNTITDAPRGIVLSAISTRSWNIFQPSTVAGEGGVPTVYPDGYQTPAANQNLVVENNQIRIGAAADPYNGGMPGGIFVAGNNITGSTGIPTGNYYISGVKIAHNIVNGAGLGISLRDGRNITISDNSITSQNSYGIHIDGASFTIQGNTIQSGNYNVFIKDGSGIISSGSITNNKLTGPGIINHGTGKVTESGNNFSQVVPKLTGVDVSPGAVKITWQAVTGVDKYRVFYKTGGGDWRKIANTTDTSYTWKDAAGNTTYAFTVRGITADGKSYTTSYDKKGISVKVPYLATPAISDVSNTADGVQIVWGAVTGAAQYRVYYKIGGGDDWTKIANTADTSYTWTKPKSNVRYTFTVRCINPSGTSFTSSYDKAGKSITYYAAPTVKIANAASGINVTWNAVAGAAQYAVYYREGEGSWHKIGITPKLSYTWKKAVSGRTYTFAVRCTNAQKVNISSYKPSNTLRYIAAPKITSLTNTSDGVQIVWGAVTGAAQYRVYYKIGGGDDWTKIANTADTSYTWTKPKSNVRYTFTVRCISSDGKSFTSAYDKTGKSITYYAAPTVKIANAASGINVTWNAVAGAAQYAVYYREGEGSWHKIGITPKLSYTWKKAVSGRTYTFAVRCTNAQKANISSYKPSNALRYIAAPKITSLTSTSNGVRIVWGAVTGAAKYRVYYKIGGGDDWTKITNTTDTTYTWKGAKRGTTYTFTVRCISSDGKSFTSAYDKTGKSITYTK